MKSLILNGSIRIQKLDECILRIEYSKYGEFCDENTFLVAGKSSFTEEYNLNYKEDEYNYLLDFKDYEIRVDKNLKQLTGIAVYKNNKLVYKYKKIANSGELPSIEKTPLIFPLIDKPQIIVPECGYSYLNKKNNGFKVNKNASDLYLFFVEGDYKLLRKEYVKLTGRPDMVRLKTLGSWNSKYYPYRQDEAEQVIRDYENHNMPLDNIVIDTDWRKASDRGIGYDIDENLFPDMKGFFNFAHDNKVEVMLNDHPEPQDGAKNCCSPNEVKFREEKLTGLLEMGLDYWWYDRNWHTKLISLDGVINPETWGQYLFHDITRHYYEKNKKGKYPLRALAMSNIDNVSNGYYYHITNSASHRYPFQWTGDITSSSSSLMENIYDICRANLNEIIYANPDCGGHIGNPDKELFLKWMQVGSLLPVLRPHCSNMVIRYREPWNYDEETEDICRNYFSLRYRLLEKIYKDAHKSYEEGSPLVKSLSWDYPKDKNCTKYFGEYFFADVLVGYLDYASADFCQKSLLSGKDYVGKIKCRYYLGTNLEGEPILEKEYKKIDFELVNVPPEKEVPTYNFSAIFEGKINLTKKINLLIENDDGVRVYIDNKLVFDDWNNHGAIIMPIGEFEKGIHDLKIEYYQAGGEAFLKLFKSTYDYSKQNKMYLPEGEWLNPFNGKIIQGNKAIHVVAGIDELPMYLKLGTIYPLLKEANHVEDLDFSKMSLDYYPSMTNFIEDEIYEDDGKTTGYQFGEYRKNRYKTSFDEKEQAFVLDLFKAEGKYQPYSEREYILKFHLLKRYEVEKIVLDGREITYRNYSKDNKLFVLSYGDKARESKVSSAHFKVDLNADHQVKIYIKKH